MQSMQELPHCKCCAIDLPMPSHDLICGACLKTPPFFDCVIAGYAYNDVLAYLISQLKFHRRLSSSRILGYCLAPLLKQYYRNEVWPEVMIPVPLHWRRLWRRGFNQSYEIARYLGKQIQTPIYHRGIKKIKATPQQSSLSAQRRHHNLNNAFQVGANIGFDHVAILDDVVTTGATCNALAKQLKRAGVKRVDVWTVARTLYK